MPSMSSTAERAAGQPGLQPQLVQQDAAMMVDVDEGGADDAGGEAGPPQKKKQKRNKPTLSCVECVERKTKVCVCVPP